MFQVLSTILLKKDPSWMFPGNFPGFSGQQVLIVNHIGGMEMWG